MIMTTTLIIITPELCFDEDKLKVLLLHSEVRI